MVIDDTIPDNDETLSLRGEIESIGLLGSVLQQQHNVMARLAVTKTMLQTCVEKRRGEFFHIKRLLDLHKKRIGKARQCLVHLITRLQ